MSMKPDKGTIQWLGRLVGAATPVTLQSVGDGAYGLMEITKCEDAEQRTLRFLGFETAEDAIEFAGFLKVQAMHEHDDSPGGSEAKARARTALDEHVEQHVQFVAVHMSYAVTDSDLDALLPVYARPD